jgi:hypothetical protein
VAAGEALDRLTSARLEGGEPFTDVDRNAELAFDTIDPRIDPSDLGDQLGLDRAHLGAKRSHLVAKRPHLIAKRVDLGRDGVHLTGTAWISPRSAWISGAMMSWNTDLI